MLKRMIKAIRQRFCKHEFVLIKSERNEVSKRTGCSRLWYRCPKCGKMFWK